MSSTNFNGIMFYALSEISNSHSGESFKLIVESHSTPKTKRYPKKGLIAQLTDNPIKIEDFQPLTRVEANERW